MTAVLVENPENITLTLNNFIIDDMPTDEFVTLTYINPLNITTAGLNGYAAVRAHPAKDMADAVIKVSIGSKSDTFLLNARNSAEPIVFNGEIRHNSKLLNSSNQITPVNSVFSLKGGVITEVSVYTVLSTSENSAYNQYTIRFREVIRMMQNE